MSRSCMKRPTTSLVVICTVALFILASCGGDDGADRAASSESTTAGGSETAPSEAEAVETDLTAIRCPEAMVFTGAVGGAFELRAPMPTLQTSDEVGDYQAVECAYNHEVWGFRGAPDQADLTFSILDVDLDMCTSAASWQGSEFWGTYSSVEVLSQLPEGCTILAQLDLPEIPYPVEALFAMVRGDGVACMYSEALPTESDVEAFSIQPPARAEIENFATSIVGVLGTFCPAV